jgi:hypothetical protein
MPHMGPGGEAFDSTKTTNAIANLLTGQNIHTIGQCGGASVHVLVATIGGSVCFGNTGADVNRAWGSASLTFAGQIGLSVSADGAYMISNADTPEKMSGWSVCAGVGGGALGAVACVSTRDDLTLPNLGPGEEPTVIIFVGASASLGASGGPLLGVQRTWVWRITGSSAPVDNGYNPDGTTKSGGPTTWTDGTGNTGLNSWG